LSKYITKNRRTIRSVILIAFVLAVFAGLVYSRIMAYSLAPTMKPSDFHGLPIWYIPIAYIIDYFSHAWICLTFAFVAAGLVYELIPKGAITKYMGGNKLTAYALALGMAPFLTVCSCTMVPLFTSVLYSGAGIGPAISFLLLAPSSNILAIMLTGDLISWEVALVRIIASVVIALSAGIIVSKTPWGKAIEKEHQKAIPSQNPAISLAKVPLDDKLWAALKFAGYLAKKIMPFFILGLVAVSYVQVYLPENIVSSYLTGPIGVLIASVIGGPLYTPTLVEVVIAKGLVDLGMTKGPLLSWLMGQPYDVVNAVAVSRVARWKVVLTYMAVAWTGSIAFGLLYGVITGSL
jgi:uncharacterized membrane protein YraQ (UPF0718 family)